MAEYREFRVMGDEEIPEAPVSHTPDAQKPGRPNAEYGLSVKNQDEKEITFYYSRENRLSKAPQDVRDLYNPKQEKRRFSFIGPLIGSKGRTLLFSSILLMFAIIMAISIFSTSGGVYALGGNSISVQAVKYEGAIIAVVKKSPAAPTRRGKSTASPYTGVVDISASPVLREETDARIPDVFPHRVLFTAEPAEEFRFSLPFEADSVIMTFQTETSTVSVQVKVE
jgi:hypothetical protein